MILEKKSRKEEQTRRDVGRTWDAKMHKEPRLQGLAASYDREDIRGVSQEGFRTGICAASNQNVQWVAENVERDLVEGSDPSGAENQGLGIVEGSASSKTEKKPTSSFSIRRVGNVGAQATVGKEREKRRKIWMKAMRPDLLAPQQ
jgi:hypothetical protein